jgi:hypothetical protein
MKGKTIVYQGKTTLAGIEIMKKWRRDRIGLGESATEFY